MIDAVACWLAWRLPRRVVYWAMIRGAAHATTGPWGHEETPGVTITELLQRWDLEPARREGGEAVTR